MTTRTALWILGVVLTGVALVACYADSGGDTDLWWHLAYGQQVVENGSWSQQHDLWSWSPYQEGWSYVSWLSDAIYFLAYRAADGPAGPIAFQGLLYLGVIGIYLGLARLRRRSLEPFDLVLIVGTFVVMAPIAVYPKSENFSVFFFAATVALYAHARITSRDRFWALPLLFWAWSNAHGGVLVGFALLGILAAGETVARRVGTGLGRRAYLRLLGFSAAAVAAAAISPHGLETMAEAIGAMVGNVGSVDAGRIQATLSRWNDLGPSSILDGYRTATAWGLVVMLVTHVARGVRGQRRGTGIDPTVGLGMLAFFVVGMQLNRASIFLPLFFLMTFHLHRSGDTETASEAPAFSARPDLAPLAALGVLALLSVGLHTTNLAPFHWFGSGYDKLFPTASSRFVREHALPGPLFNDYGSGGYLVWDLAPERKVFIDPRYRPYERDFLAGYFALTDAPTGPAVQAYAAEHGFRTALVDHRSDLGLALGFGAAPDWTLVHLGPAACVFVRNDSIPPDVAAAIRENTDPRRLVATGNAEVLAAALNLTINQDLGLAVDMATLVREHVSPWQARRRPLLDWLDGALIEIGWKSARENREFTPYEMKGRLAHFVGTGDLETARLIAASYLVRFPDDASVRFDHACIESRRGNLEVAALQLERALETGTDPSLLRDAPALENLWRDPQYASQFDMGERDANSAR